MGTRYQGNRADESSLQEPLLSGANAEQSPADGAPEIGFVPNDATNTVFQELWELLYLTSAIFVARVSWVIIKTTDSALLGYTGTQYLAAASISDLWTQSTGVFIMGGVLGMFCSQAIGAGNKAMAGIWLQARQASDNNLMHPIPCLPFSIMPFS